MNFTVGNASTLMVNLSLSALESIGKSKTLSNPRVLTMDNEPANIQQGRSFFVPTSKYNRPDSYRGEKGRIEPGCYSKDHA